MFTLSPAHHEMSILSRACIKKGFQKNKQKYHCKDCNRYQLKKYTYKICSLQDEQTVTKLNNIGVGISGIAIFTGISKANVINKLKKIAKQIVKPEILEEQQEYEVDEMQTYISHKEQKSYIIYALNKATRRVVDLKVGARTKENIGQVIQTLKVLNPKRIFTDRLNIYPGLIEKEKHEASSYKINHIERFNLTLRTHLKRLSRRSICFSKSEEMLENCLRIYLWSNQPPKPQLRALAMR